MSILLYTVGAIVFVAGLVMTGFGVPVSEFSFGNTLITSGTTVAVGGLILVGLGAVVSQLKHIGELIGAPLPLGSGHSADEVVEAGPAPTAARPAPAAGRIPFPSRPKPEPAPREPELPQPSTLARVPEPQAAARSFSAPNLRNPETPPVTVEDDVSLSPREALVPRDLDASAQSEPEDNVGVSAMRRGPIREGGRIMPPPPAMPPPVAPPSVTPPPPGRRAGGFFDAVWPAGRRTRGDATPNESPEAESEPAPEAASPSPSAFPASPAEPESAGAAAGGAETDEPQRSVAVLKSGVVDGMGYTLYVDGSIEAELPQGTLRFASINELRAHLEKNA